MPIIGACMVPHPPLIIPQVGRGNERQVAATIDSYEKVAREIAALKPETIVITSPHTVMYGDYFHISPGRGAKGSFSAFGAGEVRFSESYDQELVDQIAGEASRLDFPAGCLGERDARLDHGVMVPLYFIRKYYDGFKLVRAGLSGLPLTDHYRFGQMIARASDTLGRRVYFVGSGDLSHKLKESGPYGFAPEGPVYDARIMDVCGRGAFGELFDFDEIFCEKAAECGHRSFVIMAGALDGMAVQVERFTHEDVTGVGYGLCTFLPGEKDESRHFLLQRLDREAEELKGKIAASDAYVQLARASVESYVRNQKRLPLPAELPEELIKNRAGVFVSIHEHGRLRGCIGTISPVQRNIALEIIENAVSASTKDPRFPPIGKEELPWLEINVDVLGEAEPIRSMEQLDVKRYGVIVTSGRRRGLLLPDLDGVDTVEDQVSIAKRKAGIREEEPVSLERFEVVRHV